MLCCQRGLRSACIAHQPRLMSASECVLCCQPELRCSASTSAVSLRVRVVLPTRAALQRINLGHACPSSVRSIESTARPYWGIQEALNLMLHSFHHRNKRARKVSKGYGEVGNPLSCCGSAGSVPSSAPGNCLPVRAESIARKGCKAVQATAMRLQQGFIPHVLVH